MNENLIKFIEDNIDLVDSHRYQDLFEACDLRNRYSLYKLLRDIDVDPLIYMSNIPKSMFARSDITDIVIPNSVTKIGKGAFEYCISLKSVTISDSIVYIEEDAFFACESLTSITIPDSVTSIGEYAFYKCNSLTSVTIPSSVTSIGKGVFFDCNSLTIYCEAESKPSGWNSSWNSSYRPVYWYSESEPLSEGNYWHYVDGEVVVWR